MTYNILKHTIGKIGRLYVRKISGEENVPKNGPYIVCANHASYMDHIILGYYFLRKMKKPLRYLAKKEHFIGLQKYWHRYVNAIPIDRQAGGKEALAQAVKELEKGELIGIYPEGTRTLTGKLNRGKTGAIRLALTAKVPIVPVGLTNTFKILPKGNTIPRFERTDVNIGKTIYYDEYYGKQNNKKVLRMLTDDLMKKIAKLNRQKYEAH
jgi:1-acyl-sn-glycerol-3-phosphate acyltransferase